MRWFCHCHNISLMRWSAWRSILARGAFLKSTLLKKLNQGDYSGASEQIWRGNTRGGCPVLLRRRKREKALFDRGVYA